MSSTDARILSTVFYYTSPTDFKNTPSPLELCYHSPSTRHLSTILYSQKPSIISEIDSAYCPQSFASWDANSVFNANRLGGDSHAGDGFEMGSISCPICESVVVMVVQEFQLFRSSLQRDPDYNTNGGDYPCTHVCMYKCGYCQWNSIDELKIYSKINMIDDESSSERSRNEAREKELIEIATNDVQVQLSKAMERRKQSVMPFMNAIIKKWNEQFKLEEMNQRKSDMLVSKPRVGSSTIANTCFILNHKDLNATTSTEKGALWSVEGLDESIIQKKNYMNKQVKDSIFTKNDNNNEEIDSNIQYLRISDLSSSSSSSSLSSPPKKQFRPSNQCTISTTNSIEERALMPTPKTLRTRAIKRDCKELSLGKPGILVKPKVNPLEGDSSLRYGQGQWWKKDSSAIYTIPKISIHKESFHEELQQCALLLRISNPTLGIVRLKVHTDFAATFGGSFTTTFPRTYQNLLMSSFPLNIVKSKVIPPNNCSTRMESVSLEPIEDAYLELGGISGNADQMAISKVKDWESNIVWTSSSNDEECNCKLVSHQGDVAYVEFKVSTNTSNRDGDSTIYKGFISTPLILEIEIGNGSWDSSLIQGKDGLDIDSVPFLVLPTWKQKF